jgi:hypothetical protein
MKVQSSAAGAMVIDRPPYYFVAQGPTLLPVALTDRGQDVTGTFALKDSHAPQHSVFRVRARVEDVNGAVTTSSPTYVCLGTVTVSVRGSQPP